MLERVEIKSFKSLLEVNVELGVVNVFIGANGSGKSNLLEAIGILGAAASGRVDDEGLLRRGVRPGVPALYKASFRGGRVRSAIRFGGFSQRASYEVELINPTDKPLPAWLFKNEKFISDNRKVVGRSPRTAEYASLDPAQGLAALETVKLQPKSPGSRLLSALRDYAIYAPNTATLRGLVSDPQMRIPLGLNGGRLAEGVEDLHRLATRDDAVAEVVDDLRDLLEWVSTFGARTSNQVQLSPSIPRQQRVLYFQDRYMAEGRNELSAYDASEGALYVLFAAVATTHPDAPPILAIDNVDAGLNPRLVRALMERLCRWLVDQGRRQLLLTCHNPLVLDGLPLQDNRVRLFAVDRSAKGRTLVKRIEVDAALLEKAKQGWPLSRLWIAGHLGGVPDV